MPTLYELSNELAAILHGDDELSDDVAERLSTLEVALEDKVEGVLQYRQGLLADADGIDAEIQRLKARSDALERKAEWMRQYVLSAMNQVGVKKIVAKTFTANVVKSPAKAELLPGVEIPTEYRREKVTVDFNKSAALEDFKAGKALPDGVKVTSGTTLRIS